MWDDGGGPNRNRPKPVLVVFTDLIRTESTKQKKKDQLYKAEFEV